MRPKSVITIVLALPGIFGGDCYGQAAPWIPFCQTDAITDKKSCVAASMFRTDTGKLGSISVMRDATGMDFLILNGSLGNNIVVRIDKLSPHNGLVIKDGMAAFKESEAVIGEMLHGVRIHVRFTDVETSYQVDRDISLGGFPEAYAKYKQGQGLDPNKLGQQ